MNKIKKIFYNIRNNHKDLFYSICFLIEFAALFGIFKAFDINFYKYHFYLLFCLISLPFVFFNRSVLINIIWCILLIVGLYNLYVVCFLYQSLELKKWGFDRIITSEFNRSIAKDNLLKIFVFDKEREYLEIFHYFVPFIFFGIPILIFKKLSKLYNKITLIPYIMQSLFILCLYLTIVMGLLMLPSACYSEGEVDLSMNTCYIAVSIASIQMGLSVLMIICYGIYKRRKKFAWYHVFLVPYHPKEHYYLNLILITIISCYIILNIIKKYGVGRLVQILFWLGLIAISIWIEKQFLSTSLIIDVLISLCIILKFAYVFSLFFVLPIYLINQFIKNLPVKNENIY